MYNGCSLQFPALVGFYCKKRELNDYSSNYNSEILIMIKSSSCNFWTLRPSANFPNGTQQQQDLQIMISSIWKVKVTTGFLTGLGTSSSSFASSWQPKERASESLSWALLLKQHFHSQIQFICCQQTVTAGKLKYINHTHFKSFCNAQSEPFQILWYQLLIYLTKKINQIIISYLLGQLPS